MAIVIVGITGGSGAGKTTVAERIQRYFGRDRAVIIEQDSYYRDHSHLPLEKRQEGNFDIPEAVELDRLADDLVKLRRGTPIEKPIYEYRTHSRIGYETVEPRDVVIVEGLFVLQDGDLRRLFDVKIFVDADEQTRAKRRIARDTAERGFTEKEVIERLRRDVLPMHEKYVEPTRSFADFLIDGTSPLDEQLAPVLERVEELTRLKS